MSRRKVVVWLLRLAVSAAVLGLILYKLPLGGIVDSLRHARAGLLLAGFLLVVPLVWFSALRLWILTRAQGMPLSVNQLLSINLACDFYGLFLPGYLAGGAIRWYKLSRLDDKPSEAIAVIGFNRMVELATALALGVLFWTLDPIARTHALIPVFFVGALLALGVLHLLVFGNIASLDGKAIAQRLLRLNRAAVLGRKLDRLFASLGRLGKLGGWNLSCVVSVSCVTHLLGIFSAYLLAQSLSLELTVVNLGWVRTVLMVVLMLPISWSGLGVREGSLILLLRQYGVLPEEAVALSLLIFFRGALRAVVGGFVETRSLFLSRRRAEA
jgi:uncharacterized protein (TIRG00374 family)